MQFYQIFCFQKLSLCGQKGKRRAPVFVVLSRLPNKEGSVPQIQIVRLQPADKKYEFWGQLQIHSFNRNTLWRWLYLARVSISIINSYCYAVVISRFTAARGFMRFQFYVNYLEKWENSAVLFLMTALILWAFSTLCQIPLMSPASQERQKWAQVILAACRSITFFF